MQEVTVPATELHRNKVEIGRNKDVEKMCKKFEKVGLEFLKKESKRVTNIFDWRVVRDASHKDLSFSKKGDKQNLTIHYEQQVKNRKVSFEMSSFNFTFLDGKTKVSLLKTDEGSWKIVRINKDGQTIEGGNILRDSEERELTNFLQKFNLNRNLMAIINIPKNVNKGLRILYPNKLIRSVVPIVGLVAGAGFATGADQLPAQSWRDLFLGPTPISQSIGNTENTTGRNAQQAKAPEASHDVIHFQNEYEQIFKTEWEAVLNGEEGNVPGIDVLGSIQELELVTNFYAPSHSRKDGQSLELEIRKYLRSLNTNGIYNYRQYDSVGRPGNALVGDLERVLIDIRNNPYSQRSVYGFLDALHRFNTGKSLVTPESIMLQSGFLGPIDNFSGQEIWNAYFSNPEIFDVGTIKATSIIFDTTSVGDLVVSADLVGRVMNINGGKMTVWVYDQATSKAKLITYTADNFPNPALGFR